MRPAEERDHFSDYGVQKANEACITELADRTVREAVARLPALHLMLTPA